ncbi:MAG: endolytic transglycosylase MltG [Acidimicrobiales bacterium]
MTPNDPTSDATEPVERLRPDAVAPLDEPEQLLVEDPGDGDPSAAKAPGPGEPSSPDGTGEDASTNYSDGSPETPYTGAGGGSPYPDGNTAPGYTEGAATGSYPEGWGPGATPNVQYQSGTGAAVPQYYDPYPQGVVQYDPSGAYEAPDDLPPWYEDEYYDDREWEHLPRRTSTLFRVLLFAACLAAVIGVTAFYMKNWVDDQLDPPGEPGGVVVVAVPVGASTNDIVRILDEEGVVANGTVFRYYLQYKDAGEFQAGEYTFQQNMAVWDVKNILEGGARILDTFSVTVPEGLRLTEIENTLLAQLPQFDPQELSDAFTTVRKPNVFADEVLFSAEGYLFPDTYELDENGITDEAALLDRMVTRFDDVAEEVGLEEGAAALGLTPYQVLIVASLIEEEARADIDRPLIARVIYNRLEAGEPLGIDATVVYALGGDRELSASDLQVDSPYNTRLYAGLPPTPIAAPGRASLEAALNPADGAWFFYVLTEENGPGTHTFARTAAEFAAAVRICIERDLGCG